MNEFRELFPHCFFRFSNLKKKRRKKERGNNLMFFFFKLEFFNIIYPYIKHWLNLISEFLSNLLNNIILTNFLNICKGDWSRAYALCNEFNKNEKCLNLLIEKGKTFEQMGKLYDAEKLYLTIQQPDLAISMYKENRQYDQVLLISSPHHLKANFKAQRECSTKNRNFLVAIISFFFFLVGRWWNLWKSTTVTW